MDADLTRQLRDTGLSEDEAKDLAELAAEVECLPEVKPRRAWLHESRWRLLRKFDERQAKRRAAPDERELPETD
jgi:hypothetical protein